MQEPKVKFVVNNFRAVEHAEIALDGISVLTGENGCGKSSISKLVYYSILYSKKYKSIVYENTSLWKRKLENILSDLYNELDIKMDDYVIDLANENKDEIDIFLDILSKNANSEIYTIRTRGILYETIVNEIINIKNITYNIRNIEPKQLDLAKIKSKSIPDIFKFLNETWNNINKNIKEILKTKPNNLFYWKLAGIFKQDIQAKNFELFEFEGKLINGVQNRLFSLQSIDSISYIDTPMSVGKPNYSYMENNEDEHWLHLNKTLSNVANNCLSISNFDQNKQTIIDGAVEYQPQRGGLTYKRKDGKILNLLNCATGLKSFSILQLLYQQNYLNDKTLLIIDEPEAHLHPQWIVEYAKLIVLLNKELGVKFLIASHHPQMISSIKYIAEKEEIDKKVNFYLAEKATEFTYHFKNHHTNIEPIFASFNIAFDKMDEYAATE